MVAKDTQGPWSVGLHRSLTSPAGTICETYSHMGCNEADANERLIAAAPEMLEALRITRGNVASLGPAGALEPYYEYREWLRMLDEVISKATGGAQ